MSSTISVSHVHTVVSPDFPGELWVRYTGPGVVSLDRVRPSLPADWQDAPVVGYLVLGGGHDGAWVLSH